MATAKHIRPGRGVRISPSFPAQLTQDAQCQRSMCPGVRLQLRIEVAGQWLEDKQLTFR